MVAAIPRPRTGILAPLEERWADAERRLQRLDPGNTAGNRPRTEIGLDALEDAIAAAAHRAQPAPISPALQAAVQELWDLKRRQNVACAELKNLQTALRRVAGTKVHQILGDIPSDVLADDVAPVSLNVSTQPTFKTAAEARAAIAAFLPHVLIVEGRVAILRAAAVNEGPETVNRKMIFSLFDRVQRLEQALKNSTTTNGASDDEQQRQRTATRRKRRAAARVEF